ncbi:unnamed protein product [Diatraea saccharalis]|uniref:Uncharacterized protein n=1 Tax=Diatraea saccharalis TaxID=40085 RepID=A0A9N9R4Q3_9NEOP|nr:unnamed protein product [Diatraea saccharalis]
MRSNSSGSSINSPLGPGASCGMAANPYAVPLYGGAPVQGYGCAPADLPHYGDMRGAGWYPASNDPRFASKLTQHNSKPVMNEQWSHYDYNGIYLRVIRPRTEIMARFRSDKHLEHGLKR